MPAATIQEQSEIDLGFWAKLMAPMGWGASGRVAKAQGLIARARAESTTNSSGAVALYTRAIDLLNSTQGLDRERKMLLGPAELSRGRLREAAGDVQGAIDSYLQARQLLPSLPLPALSYTAAGLAKKGDASERATTVYLELLRSLKGKDRPSGVAIVYESMEKRSTVSEGAAAKSDMQVALCRRVSSADPDIEWPYYYCGMDSLNQGQFTDAVRSFERCKALRSTKPLLVYYLAFSKGMDRANVREWEPAAVQFREACRATQRPDAQFWLGKCLVEWCERLAPGADRARYAEEAIGALTTNPSERRNREDAFYLGNAYLLSERFSEAERLLETAAQADSKNSSCLLYLGISRQKLGKLSKAADAARSAIALDSKLVPAHRLDRKSVV